MAIIGAVGVWRIAASRAPTSLVDRLPGKFRALPSGGEETSNDLAELVPGLVRRVRKLRPHRIILITTTVYDAAYGPMRDPGLPVVDARVPFPGSGQQCRFVEAFEKSSC
jgi:hypothetical protein